MKEDIIVIESKGLDQKHVDAVSLAFAEKVIERKLLSAVYSSVISKDVTKEVSMEARELRLKCVAHKSGIARTHRVQKEFSHAYGKYCDAWKNKETEPIQKMIDNLLEIEKYEERQEKKRLDELQLDRVNEISEYLVDANERDLSSMDSDVWEVFCGMKKKAHLDAIKVEKKKEQERLAEIKKNEIEQERIKKENAKLKKEAIERERIAEIKDKKRQVRNKEMAPYTMFIREWDNMLKMSDKDYKKEFDEVKKGAQEHWDLEKKKKETEAKEKEERKKLEAKLKEKEKAEQKKKDDEAKRIETELNKGDEAKVEDLINDLIECKNNYTFKSSKNQVMHENNKRLIDIIIHSIRITEE